METTNGSNATTNSNTFADMTDQKSRDGSIPVIHEEEVVEDVNTVDMNKTINDDAILPAPQPEPTVTVTNNVSINDVSVIENSSGDDVVAATTTKEPTATTTTATLMDITSMNSFDSTTLLPENNIITSTVDGNHIGWNTTATTVNNNNNNKTNITSVTSERKEQLLLQARYDRIQWIHQIPLPYRKHSHPIDTYTTTNHHHSTTAITTTNGSPTSSNSHAIYHLPTIPKVVQYLYESTSKSMTTIMDVDTHMTELYQQQQQQQTQEQEQMKQSSNNQHNNHNHHPNPNIYRMTGTQIMDAELLQQLQLQLIHNDNDKSLLLLQYQKYIHALEDPSAATIVQKLRSYIRQLHKSINNQNTIFKTTRNENDTNSGDDIDNVPMIITKFQSYIYSIYDTLQNHPLFMEMIQNSENDNNNHTSIIDNSEQLQLLLRRCYDSFVYGHCYSYFESLFYTDDVRDKNHQFQTNVQFLSSFVTPIHLDIHCFVAILLSSNETKQPGTDATVESVSTNSNEQYVKELLSNSVTILQSIDTYYSPYEKLQRILLLYHEINIALKRATKSTTKLPSADDVLPTFIYVILLASSTLEHDPLSNSSNLYYNLYYIEQLLATSSFKTNDSTLNNHGSGSNSSNHYLRGEAGYAYTNLYSAYQFISDFDTSNLANPFDATSSSAPSVVVADGTATLPPPPSSLSISKDAWNAAIESYKVKAQERYEAIQKASSATETLRIDTYEPDLSIGMHLTDAQFDTPTLNTPTPMEIRQARLRGETIDLNWALQHQQQKDHQLASHVSNQQHQILRTQKSIFEEVEENLPYGFQRNYNFLNARTVDDLKYNDVEQLLQEYHTLVRTTETLLSERARQITRERKVQQLQKEKALLEQEQQVILLLNNDMDN